MAGLTRQIPKDSELHKKIRVMIEQRIKMAEEAQSTQHDAWRRAEELMLAYIPESDVDAARRTAREQSGAQTYTTIQIPYTYAMVMAAHTYWTSVFFARAPIHQFTGRHGEGEMQVQALEALISYQTGVGGMTGPYYIWVLDAAKYGVGVLGTYWDDEEIQYTQLVQNPESADSLLQVTQRIKGYSGNRAYNVSPYDFYPDPRVPVGRFQQGEFCAALKRLSWNDVLRRRAQGFYMNLDHVRGAIRDPRQNVGSGQLERPDVNRTLKDFDDKDHPSVVPVFEFYCEIVPKDWGLGGSDYPEKWVFTITADYATIIGASPLGMIHGKFPFDVMEGEIEGYGLYNRGIPVTMEALQYTMDWLFNSHFYNVRAAMNNQFIIDPSRVVVSDVEDGSPGFIWRLRPEAYGSDVRQFVHQIPVNDVTRQHMSDIQNVNSLGERVMGINDAIMGQMGTKRATAAEVRTTTGFGTSRLKTVAEYMSVTAFEPHASKLVQSSQQNFQMERKLRIVGDLAQQAGGQFVNVTPEMISGFYDLMPVDGTLPVDRFAQATLWKDMLMSLRNLPPQVAMEYDFGKIFAWVASLAGLKNINQFKVQIVPDATLPGQATAGNVVPLAPPGGPSPRAVSSNMAGVNATGPASPLQ